MSKWISVDDRLPDVPFGYFLVVRHCYLNEERKSVHLSFYTKDREHARKVMPFYSRKKQGKHSVHFDKADAGHVITHWMPLPEPPEL